MRVEGINAGQAPALKTGAQAVDATSMSLQKQIENAQKQMQDLAKNDQMSPEDKMKKRQELQKQIADLNQQLRQHELELRRKEAEEAREKREQKARELGCDKQKQEQENGGGLSKDSMDAMLSADSAVRQADNETGTITRMKGQKSVLEGEIRTDKSRGISTASKEERLADLEKRIDNAVGRQIKTLAEANKKLNDTAEKEYDKRTKDKAAGDEEEKKADGKGVRTDGEHDLFGEDIMLSEEIAQKMEKEREPGHLIDERL